MIRLIPESDDESNPNLHMKPHESAAPRLGSDVASIYGLDKKNKSYGFQCLQSHCYGLPTSSAIGDAKVE